MMRSLSAVLSCSELSLSFGKEGSCSAHPRSTAGCSRLTSTCIMSKGTVGSLGCTSHLLTEDLCPSLASTEQTACRAWPKQCGAAAWSLPWFCCSRLRGLVADSGDGAGRSINTCLALGTQLIPHPKANTGHAT